ncbi:MAG: GxxExxY protein [Bryobacteraceae bacterium]
MDERDPCTEAILGAAFEVSNGLGTGFLERVYEGAMLIELQLRGLKVEQQVRYPVNYKGKQVGNYVADLVVENTVVVELKCVECLGPVHTAQCINHLRASGLKVGLLINFQRPKVEWKRFRL